MPAAAGTTLFHWQYEPQWAIGILPGYADKNNFCNEKVEGLGNVSLGGLESQSLRKQINYFQINVR